MTISMQKNPKKLRHQLTLSSDIVDHRILQSDWARSMADPTQPKMEILDATFTWWLTLCTKTKTSLDPFQRYWWSKILQCDWRKSTIVLPIKISLRCFVSSMTDSMQKNLRDILIPCMNTDDKKNPAFWLGERHSIASIPSLLERVGEVPGGESGFLNSNYKFYFTTLI